MIAMRQIMADFAKQTGQEPSAFQGAALCTFAREPLTPPERLAAAQAMGNRPVPPEWFEFDLCCGRQGGKSSFIVPCLVLYSMLNAHELFGAHAQRPATIVVV